MSKSEKNNKTFFFLNASVFLLCMCNTIIKLSYVNTTRQRIIYLTEVRIRHNSIESKVYFIALF